MIKTLEIKNFKSIKHLPPLECKRVNVLIGQPNAGKSNILEALGFFSWAIYRGYSTDELKAFIRFEKIPNLFYDDVLDEPLEIRLDDRILTLEFKDGSFSGQINVSEKGKVPLSGSYDGVSVTEFSGETSPLREIKFYRYAELSHFQSGESDFLKPPSGKNLMSLMMAHRDLRSLANQIFSAFGLRLSPRPQENKIEIVKLTEDITVSYPYSLGSDTLKRVIFHLAAILSNRDSVLIFEEPEAHAFPFYTNQLAEAIALDQKNNQYFVSTHNPYLLMPLIEKTKIHDLAVFLVYFRDYQTKVKALTPDEMRELTEMDVFANIDRFVGQA